MARYDTSKPFEVTRLNEFITRNAGKKLDVSIVRYKRSLNANSYYHLLLGYLGVQLGLSMDEMKQLIRQLQPDLYQVKTREIEFKVDGESAITYVYTGRSSADFDSKEMAESIDKLRTWASEQGIDTPTADNKDFLTWCENQIAQNQNYL